MILISLLVMSVVILSLIYSFDSEAFVQTSVQSNQAYREDQTTYPYRRNEVSEHGNFSIDLPPPPHCLSQFCH